MRRGKTADLAPNWVYAQVGGPVVASATVARRGNAVALTSVDLVELGFHQLGCRLLHGSPTK